MTATGTGVSVGAWVDVFVREGMTVDVSCGEDETVGYNVFVGKVTCGSGMDYVTALHATNTSTKNTSKDFLTRNMIFSFLEYYRNDNPKRQANK